MKKFILGLVLMVMGFGGSIGLIIATVVSPLNPWTYNGISGWYGCLLGMDLVMPLVVSLVIAVVGLLVAIWGMLDKKS